jgi:hypothetical protein
MIEGIWEGSGQRSWMCQLRRGQPGEQREVRESMSVRYLLLTWEGKERDLG